MEANLETLAGIVVGGTAAIVLWSTYLSPKLSELVRPYEMAFMEYKLNPQRNNYWELVREHKTHQDDPNYLDEFARRLVDSNKS